MNTWRRITAEGLSAVTVFELRGDLPTRCLRDGRGCAIDWPDIGEFRHCQLCSPTQIVDEVLVVGTAHGAELHVHGGLGSASAVEACLGAANLVREIPGQEMTPRSASHAWALLSAEHGPLAPLRQYIGHCNKSIRNQVNLPCELQQDMMLCLDQVGLGERLAITPVVAIVGAPNAGKSTLFNAIVGANRALVAPEAGTTRDEVRALIELDGIAVEVIDTAGSTAPMPLDARVGLLVHLLSEPDERDWRVRPGQIVVRVSGFSDRSQQYAVLAASGLSGVGIPQLLREISRLLALPHSEYAELWAPAEPELHLWIIGRRQTAWPHG